MAKHGFRVNGVGRRVCDILGCWQHWPCGMHGVLSVGTLPAVSHLPVGRRPGHLSHHTELEYDPTCLDCGYAVCSCPPAERATECRPRENVLVTGITSGLPLPTGWESVGEIGQRVHTSGVYVFPGLGKNPIWYTSPFHRAYPSALQAMAAALGATVRRRDTEDSLYDFSFDGRCWYGGYARIAPCRTADEAAYAACEQHAAELSRRRYPDIIRMNATQRSVDAPQTLDDEFIITRNPRWNPFDTRH